MNKKIFDYDFYCIIHQINTAWLSVRDFKNMKKMVDWNGSVNNFTFSFIFKPELFKLVALTQILSSKNHLPFLKFFSNLQLMLLFFCFDISNPKGETHLLI